MKRKNIAKLVFVVVITIGLILPVACSSVATNGPIIKDIMPASALELIEENHGNPDFVILDVRTEEEFTQGYIEGVINIDFYSETFQDELDSLDKDKKYLVYCQSANRSGNAIKIMEELGFHEVYNMLGGIALWQAQNYPVVP
ncbi:rhodanese-like domain-containing protein [Chloroflexota bacterium]